MPDAAEHKANPLLTVTLAELFEKDVAFVEEPWQQRADDPAFAAALRSDAVAIRRATVRGQPLIRALRRLCERAPILAVAPFVFDRARAKALLAWLEDQPRSKARDAVLSPLHGAVTRKRAFAILFDTV